jgi:thiol-disulfide isomerase/thioredoxin
MRPTLAIAFLIAGLLAGVAVAQEEREVQGRVVDDAGRPVAGAAVCSYWSANGTQRDAEGKPLKLPEDLAQFYSHLGEMEPSFNPAVTDAAGCFTVRMLAISHQVMALDAERRRGGLAMLVKDKENEPLEIKLAPLVKVRGRFVGPDGKPPKWTFVYLEVPEDPTRPLDFLRMGGCGSYDARFEFSLPPGRYLLDGYNDGLSAFLVPRKSIELTADAPELDLGVLQLSPVVTIATRREQAKAAGTWPDTKQLYGKPCPEWHAVDARGIDKQARPADFRGKWVLVDFWGLSCDPCLRSGLPRLQKFSDEHAHQREQFEIVTICMDPDGELKSIADLDRSLAPIVQHVWNGKQLSLPILLDPSFTTWERFGLSGMGQTMLIDPDGNLREGDESTLTKQLK